MIINTMKLKQYIIEKFPTAFQSQFNISMLDNIIDHMQDIPHGERINYILDMIPEITKEELKQFLY